PVPHVLGERLPADPPQVGEPVGVEPVLGHPVLRVVEGAVPRPLALERHAPVVAAERIADAAPGALAGLVGETAEVGAVAPAEEVRRPLGPVLLPLLDVIVRLGVTG